MGTNSAAVAAGDAVGAKETGAFLNGGCISDPSLRQEVESLLAASDEVRSSFLESPLAVGLARGTRLGEYKVRSLLGAGGMGEVYRAGSAPAPLRAGGHGGCGSESPEYSGRLRWARMKARRIWFRNCSKGRRCGTSCGAHDSQFRKRSTMPYRSRGDWRQRTRKGSCIAI